MTEAQQAAIIGNAAFETAPVEWQEDGVIFMQTEDDVGPVDEAEDLEGLLPKGLDDEEEKTQVPF